MESARYYNLTTSLPELIRLYEFLFQIQPDIINIPAVCSIEKNDIDPLYLREIHKGNRS